MGRGGQGKPAARIPDHSGSWSATHRPRAYGLPNGAPDAMTTLRRLSSFYRLYERVTAASHAIRRSKGRAGDKWRQRIASFRNGIRRIPGENFVVFLASAKTGKVVELKAPTLSYYADPFIWQHRGRSYLFCEQFRFLRNKARLRCISLDSDLRPVASCIIASGEGHASFPFLVEDAGTLYLIPETREEGGIHLYRCDGFPGRWTRLRTLVPAVDAVDTVAFRHDDCWWLITSIVIRGRPDSRYLAVFFADSLSTGEWQPHPINSQMLYSELPYGSGRNAGAVIRSGGRLLRPSQHNARYYGEAVIWMEITTLTKTDYSECPLPSTDPLAQIAAQLPMHHITRFDSLIAWDVRARTWSAALNAEAEASRALSVAHGRKLADILSSLA